MSDRFEHPTFDDLEPEGDLESDFGSPFDTPLSTIEDELDEDVFGENELGEDEFGDEGIDEDEFDDELGPQSGPRPRPKTQTRALRRASSRRSSAKTRQARVQAQEDGRGLGALGELDEWDDLDWEDPETPSARRDPRAAAFKEDAALLGALSRQLTRSRHPAEVAALVGASVPVALRAHPQVYGALWPLAPALATHLTRATLRQKVSARALPKLLERITVTLARQAQGGYKLTAAHVERAVQRHTAKRKVKR